MLEDVVILVVRDNAICISEKIRHSLACLLVKHMLRILLIATMYNKKIQGK